MHVSQGKIEHILSIDTCDYQFVFCKQGNQVVSKLSILEIHYGIAFLLHNRECENYAQRKTMIPLCAFFIKKGIK